MDPVLSQNPYYPGRTYTSLFTPEPPTPRPTPIYTTFRITQPFHPFTQSCVFSATLHPTTTPPTPLPPTAVIKLYDRRFSLLMREQSRAIPWSPRLEAHYQTHGDNTEKALHRIAEKYLKQELEIYRYLQHAQGGVVCKLYGTIRAVVAGVEVGGLVLEMLAPACTLRTMQVSVPREQWEGVAGMALRAVREVGVLGVVTRDVKLENVMVVWDGEGRVRRCVVLDFAHARARGKVQDWEGLWRNAEEERVLGRKLREMLGEEVWKGALKRREGNAGAK